MRCFEIDGAVFNFAELSILRNKLCRNSPQINKIHGYLRRFDVGGNICGVKILGVGKKRMKTRIAGQPDTDIDTVSMPKGKQIKMCF